MAAGSDVIKTSTGKVTPAATVNWAHDVFGNAVATASFEATTDRLVIDSAAHLQLGGDPQGH